MDTKLIVSSHRIPRRRHTQEFKAKVIAACQQPGMSMAAVALANGLNANMLRKWVIEAERQLSPDSVDVTMSRETVVDKATPGFIQLSGSSRLEPSLIHVEIQRAGTTINVSWPSSAAPECGAWLRELLR